MYWSSRNTTLIGRPLLGSSASAFSIPNAGEWRSTRPTWLIDAGPLDRLGHLRGGGQVDAERLLAEHGQARCAAAATSRGCSAVHVHT